MNESHDNFLGSSYDNFPDQSHDIFLFEVGEPGATHLTADTIEELSAAVPMPQPRLVQYMQWESEGGATIPEDQMAGYIENYPDVDWLSMFSLVPYGDPVWVI
jgi:hypothetical protein